VLWLVRPTAPSVTGEPRQVISRFAASTADPDSFTTCAAYTAADGAASHSPATGTVGYHTDAPKPRNSLWVSLRATPYQDDAPPVPAVCMPGHNRGLRTALHQTVNPKHAHQLRPISSGLGATAAPSRPSLPLIRRVRLDRPDDRRRAAATGLSLAQ
jgi:hypothetical protein